MLRGAQTTQWLCGMEGKQREYCAIPLEVGALFSPGQDNPCCPCRRCRKVVVIFAANWICRPVEVMRVGCTERKQVHDLEPTILPLAAKAVAAPKCRVIRLLVSRAWIEEHPEKMWVGLIPSTPQEVAIPPSDNGPVALPLCGFSSARSAFTDTNHDRDHQRVRDARTGEISCDETVL
jgi:hypothetical protein